MPPQPPPPRAKLHVGHVPPGGESLWKESLCTGQLWRGWPRCALPVTLINTKFSQAHSIHTICQLTNRESDPQRTAKKELYWSSDLCHVSQSGECLQFGEPEVICFYPQFFFISLQVAFTYIKPSNAHKFPRVIILIFHEKEARPRGMKWPLKTSNWRTHRKYINA